MLNQMRQNFKADLAEAMKKAKEQSLSTATPAPSSATTFPHDHQPPTTAHSSRRSRSPPRQREPHRDDQWPYISYPRSPRRHRDSTHDVVLSHRGCESSVSLRSVSPDHRNPSYDFNQEDYKCHSSHRQSPEPLTPPRRPQSSHPHHKPAAPNVHPRPRGLPQGLGRLGNLGQVGKPFTNTCHSLLVARSNIPWHLP